MDAEFRGDVLMNQTFLQFVEISKSMDWSAWVTASATFLLCVLTGIYVWLTRKILSAQSDPCIILTVVHDEERPTMLQLVARNIGSGLAHDIRFEYSRPLPENAWGLTSHEAKEVSEMKSGPLIDGIPALGPGECRKVDWGQYGGLVAALNDQPINATCKFKKNKKDMIPTKCILEVASFAGTEAVERSATKVAKELGEISKNIRLLATGFNKLNVNVVSLPPEESDSEIS